MIWMTEKLHRQNLQPLGAYDILLPPMSYVLHSRAFGQLLHSKLSFTVRNLAGNGALNFLLLWGVLCGGLFQTEHRDLVPSLSSWSSLCFPRVQVMSFPGVMSLAHVN